MVLRLIKKELKKNKVIMLTLFTFILLSAMLVSSALIIVVELNSSLNNLFEQAKVPSYVQMYDGDLSQKAIDDFSEKNDLVKAQQTVTMLSISGENLFLQENGESEANSIIENSFVKQNTSFDFLLDTNNKIAQVTDGQIAVPIYHKQQYELSLGSKVKVQIADFVKTYTITSFVRDAQMNPSLVTSKRFLFSDNDWNELATKVSNREYLIEFELKNEQTLSKFEKQYEASTLPQSGTTLTNALYKVLNSLTDGIIVAIISLISVLLLLISFLCLRFTILTAIEEDYRDIGIMKAVGISNKDIRKIYLIKYILVAATACITGYFCSLVMTNQMTQSIVVYMGMAPKTSMNYLLPLLGSTMVFLFIFIFCRIIFCRFKKLSAYQALQIGHTSENRKIAHRMRINGRKHLIRNLNIFIGVREVLTQIRVYGLLILIFSICLFLMSVPVNFLNTVQSPSFISYMGAGKSDLRIDIHGMKEDRQEFEQLQERLKKDMNISKQALYTTSVYQVKNAEGESITIKVENSDDYDTFPLSYNSGKAPGNKNEIALSSTNADEFKVNVGDKLAIMLHDQESFVTVCGIYQDVTNGGKTAKGMFQSEDVLWHTINLNLKDFSKINEMKTELEQEFKQIKVTNTNEYIQQTLGGVIQQVYTISIVSIGLALLIVVLITSMFFKMILAKEAKSNAIMKSIGISSRTIRVQYITRAIFTLVVGIVIGMIATNVLGTQIASILLSGVSNLRFVTSPVINYIMIPSSLVLTVSLSIFIVTSSIKKLNIMLIVE